MARLCDAGLGAQSTTAPLRMPMFWRHDQESWLAPRNTNCHPLSSASVMRSKTRRAVHLREAFSMPSVRMTTMTSDGRSSPSACKVPLGLGDGPTDGVVEGGHAAGGVVVAERSHFGAGDDGEAGAGARC